MTSFKLPVTGTATTIDLIGEDLLQIIVGRLPATSFASAACVSRSWNTVCSRVLSRPKLSSACSFNPSLQAAVEEVVSKVLSEPIRPHFAIASVGDSFRLDECYLLITTALGSQLPVVINRPRGIIGRDASSGELRETLWEFNEDLNGDPLSLEMYHEGIMLVVGFLPGLKVRTIPLLKQHEESQIDKFVVDIREFSTSVSGCKSPAAIIMFGDCCSDKIAITEKLDYAMSPETVIVGDSSSLFQHTNVYYEFVNFAAVALVFAVDRNKPPGTRETQFHAVLSSGLSPVGPTYRITSVIEKYTGYFTCFTARREGAHDNTPGATILSEVYNELGGRNKDRFLYIAVTKRRKLYIGQEKAGRMMSLAFYRESGRCQEYLSVNDAGIKAGDTFRFYYPDSSTALSSATTVSNYLRSFNQRSNCATGGDKREVFGGLIFTSIRRNGSLFGQSRDERFFGQPNIDSLAFSNNFPGVTLGGIFCNREIGRGDLTLYVKDSQEQESGRCCLHAYSAVCLIMSYFP